MTAAMDIIQASLEMIKVYMPGETVSQADAARCFDMLNVMLDEWAARQTFVYNANTLTVTIGPAQPTYTIGNATASNTSARPQQITYGPNAASVTVAGVTTPVNVVSSLEYQELLSNAPPPGTPDTLFYAPRYPQGFLNLLPTPLVVGTLSFQAWYRLTSFATPTQSYTFAVGVQDALRDNLAVEATAYFKDAPLDQAIAMRAAGGQDFLRYNGQTSRAMLNRFTLSTKPQKVE